jgi:hypothetical protein
MTAQVADTIKVADTFNCFENTKCPEKCFCVFNCCGPQPENADGRDIHSFHPPAPDAAKFTDVDQPSVTSSVSTLLSCYYTLIFISRNIHIC